MGGIAAAHPLDPLNAPEIEAAVAALRAAGAADDATRFVAVDLAEPPKSAVLPASPRRAARMSCCAAAPRWRRPRSTW